MRKRKESVQESKTTAVFLTALAVMTAVLYGIGEPSAFADKYNTETSSSARALGMGDAAINTERDAYSVFYNPANLSSKETKTNFQLVNFQVDGDQTLLSNGLGALTSTSLGSTYTLLQAHPDTYMSSRYSVYPNVAFKNFSVGVLYEKNQSAMYRSADDGFVVQARDRFAIVGATSVRLFSGILRLGANVQLESVGNSDVTLGPSQSSSTMTYSSIVQSGTGLSKNAGATITLPFRYLPSFSFVARDIAGTSFGGPKLVDFGSLSADTQPMTFDAAAGITVILARRLEMKAELDYRDLFDAIPGQTLRHVFTGAEFIAYDSFKVRLGMMHGYPTAGLGIKIQNSSIDFSMYSEETDDRLRGNADRRFTLQYTLGFLK